GPILYIDLPMRSWHTLPVCVLPRKAPVLTDTLDGDGGVIEDGDLWGERPNDQRGRGSGRATKATGSGRRGCASRVETASLSLVIARPRGLVWAREAVLERERWSGERCDPL